MFVLLNLVEVYELIDVMELECGKVVKFDIGILDDFKFFDDLMDLFVDCDLCLVVIVFLLGFIFDGKLIELQVG